MSTKQAVIFTFMIIFLALFLGALGAWFYFSNEVEARASLKDVLVKRDVELKNVINDVGDKLGLKNQVAHPVSGLEKQLTDATALANHMKSGDGMAEARRALYEGLETDITGKMPAAQGKWKSLYEEWTKLNGDIEGAVKKLKAQTSEAEQKGTESQAELDRELQTEQTEKKKITEERKKYADDIGGIRALHEQVLDKVSEVTRETRKAKSTLPQGRVIHADDALRLVTLDVGREHGIKKGLRFDLYSSALAGMVKKAVVEIVTVKETSSDAMIVPTQTIFTQDPQTGWVPTDPRMKFSVYSAGGPDETSAVELVKPKTREDRIAAYRIEKLERELGKEAADEWRRQKEQPAAPPVELGKGFVPIMPGDWINNPDFVPIVSDPVYQKHTVDELLAMQDVNLAALTFHITDSVRPYRREFLRRLAERNRCKTTETMSSDVNYVVTPAGLTRLDLLEEKLASSKDKPEVSAEIAALRKTRDALAEGKKIGAQVIAEDELEAFFGQRQRKAELTRGTTVQPGRNRFFVAGETRERSVSQTLAYIKDHGGVPATELGPNVDYVVVGAGLDLAYIDKIKRMGLKIIREDELPRFFGLK